MGGWRGGLGRDIRSGGYFGRDNKFGSGGYFGQYNEFGAEGYFGPDGRLGLKIVVYKKYKEKYTEKRKPLWWMPFETRKVRMAKRALRLAERRRLAAAARLRATTFPLLKRLVLCCRL